MPGIARRLLRARHRAAAFPADRGRGVCLHGQPAVVRGLL